LVVARELDAALIAIPGPPPTGLDAVEIAQRNLNLVWRLLLATPAGKKPSRALEAFLRVLALQRDNDLIEN
jgi:hypothetical protein